MEMTDEEYEEVIKELLERSKDMIYIGNMITKEQMEKFATTNEPYKLEMSLTILGGDIRQILGRIRRKS
jgi:Tfp pilus assembly ATPase PilU